MVEPRGAQPDRRWAVVRLLLGLLQIMGATSTLFLLVHTGVSTLTLGAGVITCVCLATSLLLFGRGRRG